MFGFHRFAKAGLAAILLTGIVGTGSGCEDSAAVTRF